MRRTSPKNRSAHGKTASSRLSRRRPRSMRGATPRKVGQRRRRDTKRGSPQEMRQVTPRTVMRASTKTSPQRDAPKGPTRGPRGEQAPRTEGKKAKGIPRKAGQQGPRGQQTPSAYHAKAASRCRRNAEQAPFSFLFSFPWRREERETGFSDGQVAMTRTSRPKGDETSKCQKGAEPKETKEGGGGPRGQTRTSPK